VDDWVFGVTSNSIGLAKSYQEQTVECESTLVIGWAKNSVAYESYRREDLFENFYARGACEGKAAVDNLK